MVKTKTKKIYDFNMPGIKNGLVKVLKKRKNESTIADLVADSGIPKYQVEQTIKVILNEYRGHLKATESGELIYYFPYGMRNQVKGFIPALKRFLSKSIKIISRILAFLFKVWIMVMLIGYFILFLVILIGAVVGAIALSAAGSKGRSSRGSKGGIFFLVFKLFELFARIWFYGQLLKGPQYHKKGRSLHKAVFAFIFGEPDPNKDWETEEKKYVISYIQSHKGIITLLELMAITGKDSEVTNQLLNRYLIEYEGEPSVTDAGTIYYFFPELLKTSESLTMRKLINLNNPVRKEPIPFNYNMKKKNGWIAFFNGFNLAFGSYFLYYALTSPDLVLEYVQRGKQLLIDFAIIYRFVNWFLTDLVSNPSGLILIVLGIIPLIFSFFFYLIPIIRNIQRKKQNELIKQENLSKKIYHYVHRYPSRIEIKAITPKDDDESPKNYVQFTEKVIKRLAGEKYGEVEAVQDGSYYYSLQEVERENRDIESIRESIDLNKYAVGDTVFDSGE